jgi:hypothetical protein
MSFLWLLVFFRFTALFYAAAAIAVAAMFRRLSSRHFRRALIVGFVFFTLLPFDISFRYHSGSPRIMRVVYGLPTRATAQRADRGEILLGGCVVNGYYPIWVLVW